MTLLLAAWLAHGIRVARVRGAVAVRGEQRMVTDVEYVRIDLGRGLLKRRFVKRCLRRIERSIRRRHKRRNDDARWRLEVAVARVCMWRGMPTVQWFEGKRFEEIDEGCPF